jgi:demethylmenaquinone methyltransferase/2-methoxy-6-polyprenyl-1,4-benzoquinol methylase
VGWLRSRLRSERHAGGQAISPVELDFIENTFDRIAPRYDIMNRLISFGLDLRWRKKAVDRLLALIDKKPFLEQSPAEPSSSQTPLSPLVIDLACGTGDLAAEAQKRGLVAVGVDISEAMLAHAHCRAPLVRADVGCLPFKTATFCGALSGFSFRNLVDQGHFLDEVGRVLRNGAPLVILEIGRPKRIFLRLAQRGWLSKGVPVLAGLLADRQAYKWLGESLARLPDRAEFERLLEASGFTSVTFEDVDGGLAQIVSGIKTG